MSAKKRSHAEAAEHGAAADDQTLNDAAVSEQTHAAEEGSGPSGQSTSDNGDLRGELDSARERHLRLAAEFDNYRKRAEREKADSWTRAQAQLAGTLLDALDDLQRIADFDPETTSAKALHEGAEMVERKFLRVLEGAGLDVVDAEGKPFDPMVHEAITTVATDAAEEDDTVADVFQKGYRFKGVLLRPARVRVKKHG